MREFLAALACVVFLPFGWIELTKPDVVRASRSPTLQEVTKAPMGSVPQREVTIEPLDPAPLDLSFAPVRETLPMPLRRPPAAVLLLAEARAALGKGPRDLGVRPDLWCADWTNKALRALGLQGTGSALAASFKPWGKASPKPCVGCVGVMPRRGGSGHVVIIDKVRGRYVDAYSPNGGKNRMRYSTYPVSRFTAFRVPA